jgi:predicted amidohydrolase YtcJ
MQEVPTMKPFPIALSHAAALAFFFTAVFAVTAVAAPRPRKSTAAVIFHDGTILTLDPAHPHVEAIAIGKGKILAMGSLSDVKRVRGKQTKLIDLHGNVLMPSLNDHHVHLLNIGLTLLNHQLHQALFLDLTKTKSEKEIAQLVAKRAAHEPKGAWILGNGWSQNAWGQENLPTRKLLDRAAPDNPVYLIRVDGHCGWANEAALREAGITSKTPDPPGGKIGRLPDGSPSGILLERANDLVLKHVPTPTDAQVTEAFRLATQALASHGITTVYDAGFLAYPGVVGLSVPLERYFHLLVKLDREHPLPIHVNLMVIAPTSLANEVLRNPKDRVLSPRLRVTHIKLFSDGALGSRSAALSHPYADDPSTRGVLRMTEPQMHAIVLRALAAGLGVATHAIGDRAIHDVLNVYQSVLQTHPDIAPGRLRIEHFSYAQASDFRRAAHLGILLAIQPGFVYPDAKGHEMEDSRVGPKNSERAYAWARLRKDGARLAGSSDDFSYPSPPLWNYYAAVTRQNPEGLPPKGWHPDQRLPRLFSLKLFTRLYPPAGGPPSSGELQTGAPSNLAILSANPLTVSKSEILKIKIRATLLAGRVTYSDGTLPDLR